MSYLTLKANDASVESTFVPNWESIGTGGMQYRVVGATEWTDAVKDTAIPVDTVGIELKADTIKTSNSSHFFMSGSISASGDITSLTNGVGGDCTLANGCYQYMFYYCTTLTAAPALPATTLADYCYDYMFHSCTSLITPPPALPATTLAKGCYSSMFRHCPSLIAAPALPATTLATNCYHRMFYGCSSLTAPPALPATTLAEGCYYNMFYRCSSLIGYITAEPGYTLIHNHPTTSVNYWNTYMYFGLNAASTVPETPSSNTNYYFKPATPTPSITGKKLDTFGADNRGVIVLPDKANYLTFKATSSSIESTVAPNWSSMEELYYRNKGDVNWIPITEKSVAIPVDTVGVELKGKNLVVGMASWTLTGSISASGSVTSLIDGIGINPNVVMQPYHFSHMFAGQTALVNISHDMLPAAHCVNYCYWFMFCGTGITSIPEGLLQSQWLEDHCYSRLFRDCTKLTGIPAMLLPCASPSQYAYSEMFCGCTSLVNVPVNLTPAITGPCQEATFGLMFQGCTKLESVPNFQWSNCFQPGGFAHLYKNCTSLKFFTAAKDGYSRAIWFPAATGKWPYRETFLNIHPDSDVPVEPSGNCWYYTKD